MLTPPLSLETRCLSSLSKVFADTELMDAAVARASALQGETFSFQVAFRPSARIKHIQISAASPLPTAPLLRRVGLAPSDYPIHAGHDEHLIRSTPGLYPDPLYPITEVDTVTAVAGQWRAVWVTAEVTETTPAGRYPITIRFETQQGEQLAEETFELEVVPAALPPQKLLHTEWFHTDCLAQYYGVDVFSEAHWTLIESYVRTAVRHGMNMILTPIFTPPLDTAVGGERPTVQLVDVEKNGDSYTFGFDRLTRWIGLCQGQGIRYFEFSHLFTQWGAGHAPKIVGRVGGETVKLFGWETDAAGAEYRDFLDQFLPQLVDFIRKNGLEQVSYFHVSDEPKLKHLEAYEQAAAIINRHLSGFPRIDALSNFEFYERGLVPTPIPASNHIEPFLEHEVPGLWTYYCTSQFKEVSNRYFCFPSARNRIIGMQLYKFGIVGFLHWGYNFWNSQLSTKPINPFLVTDSDMTFPSGDPFLVYPGPDGPIESLRMEVFTEALQDLRALELLEQYIGKERVVELLEAGLEEPITFKRYPRSLEWLLAKREEVNRLIQEHAAGAK